jgi:hypothetical protein
MVGALCFEIMPNLDLRQNLVYSLFLCVYIIIIATSLSEKERFVNSVINALGKDEALAVSKSMASALVFRAQVYQDDNNKIIDEAWSDAIRAAALDPQHPTVWRVLATIEEERQDPVAAIQALSQWAANQPQFATKVQKEIARLRAA